MSVIELIPIYLVQQRLAFKRCELIPGVSLQPLENSIKVLWQEHAQNPRYQHRFSPTHEICIHKDEYLAALATRVRSEGLLWPQEPYFDFPAIVSQVMLGLVLGGRIGFRCGGSYTMEVDSRKRKRYRSYAPYPILEITHAMSAALLKDTSWQVKARDVRRVTLQLDRYFRSGTWWTDRISVALKFVQNALYALTLEEAFIDLTTALEALLLTRSDEIAHTLAERVAVLLDSPRGKEIETYRAMKECYKIRSQIVHGRVVAKKGTVTNETLVITARRSNVPLPAITPLLNLVIAVINKFLDEPELLNIIQRKREESEINRDIDDFFLKKLIVEKS